MSHNILKSVFVVALGGLFGYSTMKYFIMLEPKGNNRLVASAAIRKLKHTVNTTLYYDAKIQTNQISTSNNNSSTILISVTAKQNFSEGLVYHWNIPQDVTVVSGETDGDFGAFTEGQTKIFQIDVKNFSKQERKYISFEISGNLEQRPVKHDLLVSSRIEDSFEHQIQQNSKQPANEDQKIQTNSVRRRFNPDDIIH